MADGKASSVKLEAPVQHKGRKGFLPIPTNRFDRIFISVVLFIAISLLWMRFVEPLGVPLWISTVLCILLGIWIVRNG
jgi:predicted small integral membrane protein